MVAGMKSRLFGVVRDDVDGGNDPAGPGEQLLDAQLSLALAKGRLAATSAGPQADDGAGESP